MPSDSPPSYQAATGQPGQPGGPGRGPALNITTPQGETRTASQDALGDTGAARRPGHSRSASDVSDISDVESDGGISPGLLDEEGRRSMDDEQRELPEGWVRCWDPKNEHHFYVDTATKRSTWLHPYDDPEFLRTLPEHHPAHPNSAEATAMRKRGEDEALLVQKAQSHSSSGPGPSSPPKGSRAKGASATNPDGSHAWPQHDEHRNWIQRKKDQLIGTKEERAKAKEDRRKAKAEAQRKRREMEEQYLKRRQELMRQQLNDPNIRNYYASDPFSYSAPAGPYSRAGGLYASPYGYGYPGGYGRRYGYGYGSPYGYGYGAGGLGMGGGMMLGGGAGLLGGMMLGDALAGGF